MPKTPRTSELHKLLRKGVRANYSRGQIIQSTEGQKTINLVTKGYVKRYLISNTGNLGVEVLYAAGDIFPLTLMFATFFDQDIYEGPEVYFYEAMSDTTVYSTDINALAKAVEANHTLYKYLLLESGRRLHSTLNSLENLALQSPYNRVAHQLVYLAKEFGEQKKTGIKITIPLTKQDLADILRLNDGTVSTCLLKLRDMGLIKNGKYIIVPDLEKLKEEAHS